MRAEWRPSELEGVFDGGTRWVLWQTDHAKGYPHYLGRVCRHPDGTYVCEVGQYQSMRHAAEALFAFASGGIES